MHYLVQMLVEDIRHHNIEGEADAFRNWERGFIRGQISIIESNYLQLGIPRWQVVYLQNCAGAKFNYDLQP